MSDIKNYKLVFIDVTGNKSGQFYAYFTDKKITGKNWGVSPFHLEAEAPETKNDTGEMDVLKIVFERPIDCIFPNEDFLSLEGSIVEVIDKEVCQYSVDLINEGVVPWISGRKRCVWAGESLRDFLTYIEE